MPYTEAESEAIKERVLAALETVIDPRIRGLTLSILV